MAMKLPYRFKFVSRVTDATGNGQLLRMQIVDSTLITVKKDVTINISNASTVPEVLALAREQIDQLFVENAGSRAALIDALIANGTLFDS